MMMGSGFDLLTNQPYNPWKNTSRKRKRLEKSEDESEAASSKQKKKAPLCTIPDFSSGGCRFLKRKFSPIFEGVSTM